MFEKFFEKHPNYTIVSRPTVNDLATYRNLLPIEIIDFWEQYGFGNFMNGYLKMVNPIEYQEFMKASYSVFLEPAIVFGVTAFGDLLIWEKEWINQVNYRKALGKNQGSRIHSFFNRRLATWGEVEPSMDAKQFLPALEKLGECAYDECYAYVPALALGGAEKVENLQKVKLREHMMILSGLVGIIE